MTEFQTLGEVLEQALEEPAPLYPPTDLLRKVYAVESAEALDLCRRLGVPTPKE